MIEIRGTEHHRRLPTAWPPSPWCLPNRYRRLSIQRMTSPLVSATA